MPRKRMILEEIAEDNPLVPGTPANPLKLGEKAKNILVHLKLYEDDGRPGNRSGYDSEYAQAWERLEFLKLIEFRPTFDDAGIAAKQGEITAIRERLAAEALTMSAREINDASTSIMAIESKIANNTKIAWLTDEGRAVLLSGSVTVSL